MTKPKLWSLTISNKYSLLILVLIGIFSNSCVTNKKTTYLQEYDQSNYSGVYTPPQDYLIKPNDNLFIRVSTPDPRQADLFNALNDGGVIRMDQQTAQILSYIVKVDGGIEFPYIGSINVAGKTFAEAKNTIESELVDYVTDPSVTIKLVNTFITVLGEVRQPGVYPIFKERMSIYEAIALAGDVDIYGDRCNVKIIRSAEKESLVEEFDLTDKNIVDSEFYYVNPSDIIYVKPMKGKFLGMSTFPWGVIFSSITATISIIVLLQNTAILNQ